MAVMLLAVDRPNPFGEKRSMVQCELASRSAYLSSQKGTPAPFDAPLAGKPTSGSLPLAG